MTKEEPVLTVEKALKNPQAHRGYTVNLSSVDQGVELANQLSPELHRVSWTCIVHDTKQDQLRLLVRHNNPCYGELRKYKKDGEGATDDIEKPNDLHWPWPRNHRPIRIVFTPHNDKKTELFDYFTNPGYSPFWAVLQGSRTFETKNKNRVTIHLVNMDIDATAIACFMMATKNCVSDHRSKVFEELLKADLSKHQASFAAMVLASVNENVWTIQTQSYTISPHTDYHKWAAGVLVPQTKGTFAEGCDYARPTVHDVFRGEDVTMKALQTHLTKANSTQGGKDKYINSVQQFFN